MKIPHSLRWQLSLSYGMIALIATISLGAVLLFSLNQYYRFQERQYLLTNAQAIGTVFETMAESSDTALLQTQITALAALIQTQIRIFDANNELLVDSGNPQQDEFSTTLSLRVETDDSAHEFSQTTQGNLDSQQFTSSLVVVSGDTYRETTTTVEHERLALFNTPLVILETPYSFGLGVTDPAIRSEQSVRFDVYELERDFLGYVELSDGPAFGRAILISVAWGVGIAGLMAVALATVIGWIVSRRLSQPIVHLARVSNRMAEGDFEARADVSRQDEIGELAQAYNRMSDQLAGLIGTLRNFVADAAHELRTPLTALRANLDLAAKPSGNGRSPTNAPFLQEAKAQLNRMQLLTDDLLHLSQLESSAVPFEKRPFDLTQFLMANQERYAAALEQAELEFKINLIQQPLFILGNETLIGRAFNNVIDNSIKFTSAGGEVVIALAKVGKTAVFTVSDSGIGLEGEPGRIFARFYRGGNATAYSGSGLGLAITKKVIDAHGGEIQAQSPDGGTTIQIVLPLV